MVAYWPPATCHTVQDFAVPEPIGRAVNAARFVNVDYPFFGILLSPMIAGAAISLSSVSVIGDTLRLRTLNLEG
jgi:hypothetical protein